MPRTSNKSELILDYVNQFIQENGFAPSIREIGEAVGLRSTASVTPTENGTSSAVFSQLHRLANGGLRISSATAITPATSLISLTPIPKTLFSYLIFKAREVLTTT